MLTPPVIIPYTGAFESLNTEVAIISMFIIRLISQNTKIWKYINQLLYILLTFDAILVI